MSVNRLRVVVVDDSEAERELIATALSASGRFEVAGLAADGHEAIELTSLIEPDLVLLDLAMPRRDGLAALPDLTAASPDTRVVILSGFPRADLGEVSASLGALGYVEKGLSPRQMVADVLAVIALLQAVDEILAEHRTELDRDARSGAVARRFVEETLSGWDSGDLVETVEWLVTELVTNAVVHGQSGVGVAVIVQRSAVRVEVTDSSPALPSPRDAGDDETSGRGLAIVESLASRWGIEHTASGKTVWFEIERPT